MFFENYKLHQQAQVRKALLWEYDLDRLNWEEMQVLIVQRVVELGRMDDFYAILNHYGLEGVKEAIKKIAYLNPKDISIFLLANIPQKDAGSA